MEQPYDPLTYENLARNVVEALLARPTTLLDDIPRFPGNGVYAIYYAGDLSIYRTIASREFHTPIYVGKAMPTGGRKGEDEQSGSGYQLHRRLSEHAKSIKQAINLQSNDFHCRYLVVMPVWITLAERFLISHFRPIWNSLIDGFGNHAPGSGRVGTRKPRWDIVHPGRPWADALDASETPEDVMMMVARALK